MDRAMGEIMSSQGSLFAGSELPDLPSQPPQPEYSGDPIVLARFSTLLEQGLEKASGQITSDLKQEFKELGSRINTIETKLDDTVIRTNQNSDQIYLLYQQLEGALSEIEDLENRSRRYNFWIRGLPEFYIDTQAAVSDMMHTLLPDDADHKLEVDRARRALMAPRPNGPQETLL